MDMTQDFAELVVYLDQKFDGIDSQLAAINAELSSLDGRVEVLEGRMDSLEKRVADTYDSLDAYAKKADMYFQEHLMPGNKVDRHDKWIHQIAEKVDVKLDY